MTDHVSPNAHIVRAKDPERRQIEEDLRRFYEQGGLPMPCPSQEPKK